MFRRPGREVDISPPLMWTLRVTAAVRIVVLYVFVVRSRPVRLYSVDYLKALLVAHYMTPSDRVINER